MQNENNYFYNASAPHSNINLSIPQSPVSKPPRKTISLDKKDSVFTALVAVISILLVDFTLFHGLNLGFTVSYVLMFSVVTLYLYNSSRKPSVFSCICGLLSLAGSLTFTVFHDYFMNFFMLILVMGLFTVYTCGISSTFTNNQGSYRIIPDMALGIFYRPFRYLVQIVNGFSDKNKRSGSIKGVLIGIGISIPVLGVVIPLLISSDEAFGSLIMLVIENIGIYLIELLFAVFVFAYLVLYLISKKKRLGISEKKSKSYKGFVPVTVSITFLTIISLVYMVYLFSQLAYFFSAFSGILPDGYTLTASEFARRGFFEMFAICVINVAIITLVTLFTKRAGKRPVALRLISSFIMLFTVLLIVTAFAKMIMNIDIFGLSKNRIMVCAFMVMLFVAVVFYVIHIINPKVSYMQCIVVVCSTVFIALAFCNVDSLVANYNIKAYENGRIDSLDVEYISELSESAVPYVVSLCDNEDADIALQAKYAIYQKLKHEYNDDSDNDFREYNYSVSVAEKACKDYYSSLSSFEKKYFNESLYDEYNTEYICDDIDFLI